MGIKFIICFGSATDNGKNNAPEHRIYRYYINYV